MDKALTSDISLSYEDLLGKPVYKIMIGTAAATVAKTCSEAYTPASGDIFLATFANGNSAANPTLNINSKGAKPIKIGSTNTGLGTLSSNSIVIFIL